MPAPNGAFFLDFDIRLASFVDGTSNTAAFSEHVKGDFSNAISTELSDTYQPGTYPADADQAYADCKAVNILDLTKQGNSNAGAPWMTDGHTPTRYYHAFPPNTRGRACSRRSGSAPRPTAATPAASTSAWPTVRSGSSSRRSTWPPGGPSAPATAARSSARDSY